MELHRVNITFLYFRNVQPVVFHEQKVRWGPVNTTVCLYDQSILRLDFSLFVSLFACTKLDKINQMPQSSSAPGLNLSRNLPNLNHYYTATVCLFEENYKEFFIRWDRTELYSCSGDCVPAGLVSLQFCKSRNVSLCHPHDGGPLPA
jgi:hypothetical protein